MKTAEMPPILILDLYEKIAENLRTLSYYKTLVALSSTCKVIRPLCQKEIFHSISILPRVLDTRGVRGYSSDDDIAGTYLEIRLRDIEQATARHPNVASYVRALNIQLHSSNFDDAGLLRLMRMFEYLTSLSLSTFYVPRVEIIWGTAPSVKPFRFFVQEWENIPQSLVEALESLVDLETMVEIDIQYIQGIPLSFFARRQRMSSLHLLHCSIVDDGRSCRQNHCLQIDALEFGLGPGSVAPFFHAKDANGNTFLDITSLSALSVHLDSETEDLFESLFKLPGVRHLHVDSRANSYSNVPALFACITPAFLSTLQSLQLNFAWRTHSMQPQSVVLISDIYAGLSGLSVLTRLELHIVVQNVKHSPELMTDMARLDNVLGMERPFATLRCVVIRIQFDLDMAIVRGSIPADRTLWLTLKNTHFPRLLSKPSLELDVQVRV